MATASPAVASRMVAWVGLGGGNSGIVGNRLHTYGFHCAANTIPADDYSRRRDPAGPFGYVDASWACAGDFHHGYDPKLMAIHASVLHRLEQSDPQLHMICEFIGKPFANLPVLYWFRGDGTSRYTGAGHDHWTHISWWRSQADQEPTSLWDPHGDPHPAPIFQGPPWPGRYLANGRPMMRGDDVRTWQSRMRARGWRIGVDGFYGQESAEVCRQFQAEKRLGADGVVGPVTWQASWALPVT